jgi:hypothetical protein
MGRFALLTMALVVSCRLALADPVARDTFLRELPLRSDRLTTLKLDAGSAAVITPVLSAPGRHGRTRAATEFAPDETSLVTAAVIGPGLFDENGELVLGSSENYFDSAMVSTDGPGVHKFDWPDFSGIVELLISESAQSLVSKYRLPGQHGPKEKEKKKTKEEHLMDGKCRTDHAPRSLFARSFHILAAAFIGTFLVIVVLRKSGRGSYWW